MTNLKKYLIRANAPIPKVHLDIIQSKKEMALSDVLPRNEINQLFNIGYLDGENGFIRQNDGSTYVSVLTQMPNVTIEMIDWWFWWHAAKKKRYQIWYPDMHHDIESDFGEYYHDDSKTYRERLHLSKHLVTEDVGIGRDKILIDFMHPSDFGFNENQFHPEEQTIICAKVASPSRGVWTTQMCHFVRKTDVGVEMRSRFWIGHQLERTTSFAQSIINPILNLPILKRNLVPKNIGIHMFHHCVQEYHNLGRLLPELYQEEVTH